MASQIDRVTSELRRRILSGELASGERIVELQFAAELAVSRTPLRLALGELEKEGLLERLPTRGFRVRRVTLDDIAHAIDVRGVLEGMAARTLAEEGASEATLKALRACAEEGRALLEAATPSGQIGDPMGWAAMNARFHQALVQGAGNPALASALAHIGKTPMAAAGALGFSGVQPALELAFLQRAQFDHEDIIAAIEAREGARAEALLREHARRSRDNKRRLLETQVR
jgi:GntR family transcriptional regulator of vanillate catabolism